MAKIEICDTITVGEEQAFLDSGIVSTIGKLQHHYISGLITREVYQQAIHRVLHDYRQESAEIPSPVGIRR